MARERWKPVAGVQGSHIFGVAKIHIIVDARGGALGSVWLCIALSVEFAAILRVLSAMLTFVTAVRVVREVDWRRSARCGLGGGCLAVFLAGRMGG